MTDYLISSHCNEQLSGVMLFILAISLTDGAGYLNCCVSMSICLSVCLSVCDFGPPTVDGSIVNIA